MIEALLREPSHIKRRVVVETVYSPADTLRELLLAGPATAAELSDRSGFSVQRIGTLLGNDIRSRRVLSNSGIYQLNPDWESMQKRQITSAARLLRKHGYLVQKLKS